MSITIHHDLSRADWSNLAALYWDGMLGTPRPTGLEWDRHVTLTRLELANSTNTRLAYDAVIHQYVGAVHALSDHARDAAIFGLVVHPAHRRQGIATRLLRSLLESLTHLSILCHASPESEPLFRKLGFRLLPRAMGLRYPDPDSVPRNATSPKFAPCGPLTSSPEIWGPGGLELAQALADAMSLPPDSLVLDVGAGSGEIACFLAESYGWRVLALEHWDGLAAVTRIQRRVDARHLSGRVIPLTGDACSLTLADASLDGVFSQGSFEMIADRRPQAMSELARVLRPGGTLGIGEPVWSSEPPPDVLARVYSNPTGGEFAQCFRTLDWTATLARSAGLTVSHQSLCPQSHRWWTDYYAPWIDPTTGHPKNATQADELQIWSQDQGAYQSIGLLIARKRA